MTGTSNALIIWQMVSTVGNFNVNSVFKYLFSGTQAFTEAPGFWGHDKSNIILLFFPLWGATLKAICAEI
jgi:hypothetical protein